MTNRRVSALRQQIFRSVGASDSNAPAEAVKKWLQGRGCTVEAENFDPNDYACLQRVERLIVGEFCPELLSA